jgi:hypothetical protein
VVKYGLSNDIYFEKIKEVVKDEKIYNDRFDSADYFSIERVGLSLV